MEQLNGLKANQLSDLYHLVKAEIICNSKTTYFILLGIQCNAHNLQIPLGLEEQAFSCMFQVVSHSLEMAKLYLQSTFMMDRFLLF